MEERIQKILSARGVCSRRKAEEYIRAGLVKVNGVVAILGQKADPVLDSVEVDGKVLEGMFIEDFLRHHPIEVADPPEPASKVNHEMSAEDEKEILQRLKDLGYL